MVVPLSAYLLLLLAWALEQSSQNDPISTNIHRTKYVCYHYLYVAINFEVADNNNDDDDTLFCIGRTTTKI